ncbi:TetR/AcrR family transcriptional regulator [Nocardioides baekrokdamisoli]|uniref:TetR/AcrR family transcriptional regulator n=1 Tax=Nocardioides baekrokdamisoli TaxID=1804624 RepID=UPI000F7B64EA|nr:TetR/AcrR family transcriptional regulator [Nocardioides baekrokdamisoli]
MASTKVVRPKRKLDGLRDRVLDEAWALLIERGVADLTLAELGRRVETSAGHLLYHFGSKDELLLDLLRRNEADLWRQWRLVRGGEAEFLAVYRAFCRQFLPAGEGDPRWLVWLELWPRGLRVEDLRGSFDELDEAWRIELADMLADAGVPDPMSLARRVCWLLDGLAVAIVLGQTDVSVDEAIEHAIASLPEDLRVSG